MTDALLAPGGGKPNVAAEPSLPPRVGRSWVRVAGVRVPDWSHDYLGMGLSDFTARLPTFLRAAARQMWATHQRPAVFEHCGGPAVMLVPGMFCTPAVFNRLGHALERRGIDVYLPRPFPYYRGTLANTGPLAPAIDILLEDLRALATQIDTRRVTLVGHSLGGVISLVALNRARALGIEFNGAILMASPVRGAPIARLFGVAVPACRDIVPSAPALTELEAGLADVRLNLVAGFDSLVPYDYQYLGAPMVVMPGFQHMDFYVGDDDQVERTAEAVAAEVSVKRRPVG